MKLTDSKKVLSRKDRYIRSSLIFLVGMISAKESINILERIKNPHEIKGTQIEKAKLINNTPVIRNKKGIPLLRSLRVFIEKNKDKRNLYIGIPNIFNKKISKFKSLGYTTKGNVDLILDNRDLITNIGDITTFNTLVNNTLIDQKSVISISLDKKDTRILKGGFTAYISILAENKSEKILKNIGNVAIDVHQNM